MKRGAEALEAKLREVIEGDVRFDRAAQTLYASDASNYRRVPLGVVLPRHDGDVAMTVALARENRVPIVARGGGTALAGQATTRGIVLDFSKYMNAITGIDPQRRRAMVQPGLVQAQLNAAAAPFGLFFAPDPATKDRCTLGGMIGNNSCGAHSAAYGKTVDNVEALDVILYDGARITLNAGEGSGAHHPSPRAAAIVALLQALQVKYGAQIRSRYPKIPRRVSGYNLDQLLPENGFNLARAFVGSEGTLGTVLSATVTLAPKPAAVVSVVLGFDDVFTAADQVGWLLEHHPQALEGFDHRLPEFAREKNLPGVRFLPDGAAFLLMELGAESAIAARDAAEKVRAETSRTRECRGVAILLDPVEQRAVWGIRESGLGAGAFIPGYPRTWPGAEDCAVPPARLGEYLRRLVPLLARYDLQAATYYGHFGEGCLHCRINFDFLTQKGIAQFRAAMVDLAALVAEFGGSLSGEHGDGLARSELLPAIFGPELIAAFREFKQIFDPDSMMNPGVLVTPDPLDHNLRFSSLPPPAPSHFDFSAESGLAGAALKCVGIGKCRKTDSFTMCPSYMATRDEMHSTRGRARLLYEALNGDLLPDGLADDALLEAMELCLSCKACKRECPASVDMAAYRAEFFDHYYRAHRRPLQSLFFGNIHRIARASAMAPRLANLFSTGPLAPLSRRILRFNPQRRLPPFAPRTFRSWFKHRAAPHREGREVLLLPDTFTNYFEPAVAIAATEVLERAGFRVTLPQGDICCGHPLMDAGMLDAMRLKLVQAVELLAPLARRGVPIIGVEPSCLLTLRDELPAMLPHLDATQHVVNAAKLFDEFIAAEAPQLASQLRGGALVHGHCHQKALAGMEAELEVLRRAQGLEVNAPDTGCCGMTGSFGYGAGRFELSRAIGERVLLPAIRASASDTLIIADGFACRSQIRQFCPERQPLHLAQALRSGAISTGAISEDQL